MTKSLHHPLTCSASLLLFVCALNAWACGTGTSTITNLHDSASDTFQVSALGSNGQLTGYFYGTEQHAFLYNNGAVMDLGTLGGPFSEGVAINSFGQVAGDSLLADFSFHGFVYTGGQERDLGTLGGGYSTPAFI